MDFTKLIIVAILVEAIWENLKMLWNADNFNLNQLGSLLIGMTVCVLTRINIFEIIGLGMIYPIIGELLTGIIVSRGANFVNDLFKKLKGE